MGRSTAPTVFLHSLIPGWLCPRLNWFHWSSELPRLLGKAFFSWPITHRHSRVPLDDTQSLVLEKCVQCALCPVPSPRISRWPLNSYTAHDLPKKSVMRIPTSSVTFQMPRGPVLHSAHAICRTPVYVGWEGPPEKTLPSSGWASCSVERDVTYLRSHTKLETELGTRPNSCICISWYHTPVEPACLAFIFLSHLPSSHWRTHHRSLMCLAY